jgi:hypothetical protein
VDERVPLRELLELRPDLGLDLDTIFHLGKYSRRHASPIVDRLGERPRVRYP